MQNLLKKELVAKPAARQARGLGANMLWSRGAIGEGVHAPTVQAIKEANQLFDNIYIGQKLFVPDGADLSQLNRYFRCGAEVTIISRPMWKM